MKKFLFLLFIAALLYGAFLFAPAGIFLFHLSSLDFSDTALYEQFAALTSVIVSEHTEEGEAAVQAVTVTLSEEDLEYVLTRAFSSKENLFLRVNPVHIEISPDLVFLEISYQYGWGERLSFETTIFSQWLVDLLPPQTAAEKMNRIGVMPVDLHTNRLYTVNLAEVWRYLFNAVRGHAWWIFPGTQEFQVENMSFQEHELAVNLVW